MFKGYLRGFLVLDLAQLVFSNGRYIISSCYPENIKVKKENKVLCSRLIKNIQFSVIVATSDLMGRTDSHHAQATAGCNIAFWLPTAANPWGTMCTLFKSVLQSTDSYRHMIFQNDTGRGHSCCMDGTLRCIMLLS